MSMAVQDLIAICKKTSEMGLIYMHYRCIFVKDILMY